jgi:hypothetical protein
VLCICNLYNPTVLKSWTSGITEIQYKTKIRHDNDDEDTNGSDSIPHRLIFTYNHNILTQGTPDHLYANVVNTIQIYRKAWESTANTYNDHQRGGDAAANEFYKHINVTGVVENLSAYDASNRNDGSVLFFDDGDCLEIIRKIEPRLVLPFELETEGKYKGDICRLAALYAYGGYYFDVDIEVIKPLPEKVISINSNVSFVTSWMLPLKNEFFQAILAVSSNHPVIRANMDVMIEDWYYNYNIADRIFPNKGTSYDPVKARNIDLYNRSETIQLFNEVWRSKLYMTARQRYLMKKTGGCMDQCELGTATLAIAYKRLKNDSASLNWTDFLLEEIDANVYKRYTELNVIERGSGWGCSWIVHDPLTSTPYFYSRTIGTPLCR